MYKLPLKQALLSASLLSAILWVTLLSPVHAQQGASVWLEPETLALHAGETAEVHVLIAGVTDLAGVEMHISFDPSLVEVLDTAPEEEGIQIAHGDFLAVDFVAVNRVDPDEGRIDYAVARMPPHPPASGSGELAVITVRATGSRDTLLTLDDVILADPDGDPIPVEYAEGTANLTPSPSFPTTCWPLGTLLVAAAGILLLPRGYAAGRLSKLKSSCITRAEDVAPRADDRTDQAEFSHQEVCNES